MKVVRSIALLVVVALVAAGTYFFWTVSVKDLPEGTYESSANILVYPTLYGFALNPVSRTEKPGLIFMAGAFVPADAYLPFARKVAEAGYPVRLIGLELGSSMAPGRQPRLFGTIEGFMDGSRPWVIGGHSLGSAQATIFAAEYPEDIAGLFITGSGYPYNDVSMLTVPVTLMRATNDNVANKNPDQERSANLPAGATIAVVEGGSHAQYGYYGPQIGDGTASISRDAQQQQMVDAALALMARADGNTALAGLAKPLPFSQVKQTRIATLNSHTARAPRAVQQEN
ncbi:Pimeloyl-ACP methyl ester carboxylesterase [Devosia lucknowensis]|uniref:Pimeloyl-ACP methyl ester carboxylesterase n=1 Tax=Devosia lucknowensis TaxID=1096929 RepID=A0A1Y6EQ30_9HYPH|nr:alpha/beta hydrolase [Devosia lucknowensis]SMQ64795.1 Pimeloyl-ACP methyl ester carboxylesterase [Devosia lucknowensis]